MTLRPALSGLMSGGSLAGDWGVQDVGSSGVSGSADYSQGEFTLRGGGAQFGSTTDDFHFVYRRLPSDGQLIARVQSLSARDSDLSDLHPFAKAGLMIRKSLDPASCFHGILLSAAEGPRTFTRPNAEAVAIVTPIENHEKIKPPYWLRLTRTRDQVSTAISADGKKWELIDRLQMEVFQEAYIGLFVSSNQSDQLATAVFDHVRATIHGLQAEYFADTQFRDLRLTRIDPSINFNWLGRAPEPSLSENAFSVRWTGQVLAPSTEPYTFALAADSAARLYLNDQMVLDTRSRVPRNGIVNLVADKRYDIRIDYVANSATPGCKLYWSSATQPQGQLVPTEQLFYAPPIVAPVAGTDPLPVTRAFTAARGVLLTDGSFLPGFVKAADEKTITLLYRERQEMPIDREKVAWLVFHPLAPAMLAKIPPATPGLLTLAGDFLEGDCQDIIGGKAKLASVVFGVSSFDTSTQIAAISFRPTASSPAPWTLHATSGATLRATAFQLMRDKLTLDEPLLGKFDVLLGEVSEIIAREKAR